jgi:hypothetical protein
LNSFCVGRLKLFDVRHKSRSVGLGVAVRAGTSKRPPTHIGDRHPHHLDFVSAGVYRLDIGTRVAGAHECSELVDRAVGA